MLMLRKIREEKEISASELARQSGISLRTIQDLEKRGYGSILTIAKLAKVLNVTMNDIWDMEAMIDD